MAILPVGAPGPRWRTRAKLVEAKPAGISGPGFESPHLHQAWPQGLRRFPVYRGSLASTN